MNSLGRLSRALAGGSPIAAQPSPPEGLKPFPATTLPPTPSPPTVRRAPTGAPTLLTAGDPPRTQSVRAWSQALAPSGPSEATIHYRLKQGWSDPQALGLSPPPPRDRTREQHNHALAHARVVVYERSATARACEAGTASERAEDDRVVLSRAEVARRLGIKLKSVAQKLRQHRPADGTQAWVEYRTLERR